MRIEVGHLIDGNIQRRKPFHRFAGDRCTKTVSDEMQRRIRCIHGRVDQSQANQQIEQRITGCFAPTRRDFIGFRCPIKQQDDFRRGCRRIQFRKLRVVEIEAAKAAFAEDLVV